ncbi:MAG: hypothetical protein HFE86_02335 [Clostridiales bacterium]|nr:hypothetical protein [Clostridiales bacterium]
MKKSMSLLISCLLLMSIGGCLSLFPSLEPYKAPTEPTKSERAQRSITWQTKTRIPNEFELDYYCYSNSGIQGYVYTHAIFIFSGEAGEKFRRLLAKKWSSLPPEEEGLQNLIAGLYGCRQVKNGFYFYSNRHKEMYGENSYKDHYADPEKVNLWQNYTLAVFDSETNTLHFYEEDY